MAKLWAIGGADGKLLPSAGSYGWAIPGKIRSIAVERGEQKGYTTIVDLCVADDWVGLSHSDIFLETLKNARLR
jgi:hypothetical protein